MQNRKVKSEMESEPASWSHIFAKISAEKGRDRSSNFAFMTTQNPMLPSFQLPSSSLARIASASLYYVQSEPNTWVNMDLVPSECISLGRLRRRRGSLDLHEDTRSPSTSPPSLSSPSGIYHETQESDSQMCGRELLSHSSRSRRAMDMRQLESKLEAGDLELAS